MRNQKNSSKKSDADPLAEDLDFGKLKRVALGKGWAQVPKHLRGPKYLDQARAWLRKQSAIKSSATTKTRRRVA